MYERLAIYPIVTEVGNAKEYKQPIPLYAKCGDSWSKYQKRKKDYEDYKRERDKWFGSSASLVDLVKVPLPNGRGKQSYSKRQAARFFIRAEWAEVFLKSCYGGKEQAWQKTDKKEEVVQDYINWFAREREEMRKTMKADEKMEIEKVGENEKAEVYAYKNVRGNHGGVANLLKVLTKTMERQGADIRSIAKVQYTVCKQAGIFIPDEFIEDVATVLYAESEERK